MYEPPDWLPPLVCLADYGGEWNRYVNEVFALFHRDFIQSQPKFEGRWVRCRRDPLYDGKEAGFWHCVQEGADEEQRTPDLRRCERVGWIRAVIEHPADRRVEKWRAHKGHEYRTYLWLGEEYLVVLGERGGYYQLITAFCTDRDHTIRKLRRERDASRNG